MTDPFDMPLEPTLDGRYAELFVTNLYDEDGVSLWCDERHPRRVVYDLMVLGDDAPADRLRAALTAVPPGASVVVTQLTHDEVPEALADLVPGGHEVRPID